MTTLGAPLIVVSGPSGVGKSTVVAEVLRRRPDIWLSVSVTTRRPRPGETDGVEYFFVNEEQFDALAADGGLLEWAQFAGNRYGTPRSAVEEHRRDGHPVLLEIEVQGARQIRRAEALAARLAAARAELAAAEEFDYVLVNADVGDCAGALIDSVGLSDLPGGSI